MREIEVNKSLFNNALGLSCIENYLLYILAARRYDYRYLYAESFVPFFDIAQALHSECVRYAYFNGIPRIMDTARNEGLISLHITEKFAEAALSYDYCCAKVVPEYIKARYGRDFWRDDHYILLCGQNEKGWIFVNDNPRDVIELSGEELSQVYGGRTLCFNILEDVNERIKEDLLERFKKSIAVSTASNKTCDLSIGSLETARDILGILRVTRKRIREYCSIYIDADFMKEYLSRLDKSYAALEYMRLRGNVDFDVINQMFETLGTNDFETIGLIVKGMEGTP